ncbi:MAG: glycosyltransferase, partial [Prevotella sp.]|nr:glycosyltransferase [Prevotella sp.]
MLDELVQRIHAAIRPMTTDYEIVLVNDCSPDGSWEKIAEICAKDQQVKGINLSRNFGQPYAITAGLTYAKGNYVAV